MNTANTSFLVVAFLQFFAGAQNMPELLAVPQESNGALRGSVKLGEEWTPVSSVDGQQVVSPQAEKDFLLEVENALGSKLLERSHDRLEDITSALRSTFESVEKNEYGKLGHTAVRYALHRLFVARHGWLMKGLDPAGQQFSSASPVQVLQGKASLRVQGIFEKRLGGQGFGLQELAVFASVLETIISQEATERLQALYEKVDVPLDARLSQHEADEMVDLYLTAYILGKDITKYPMEDFNADWVAMPELYSFWSEAQTMARQIRQEVHAEQPHDLVQQNTYSFNDLSTVVVQIGERFGTWQNTECQQMKKRLVNLEDDEEGCVPLSSFYKGAVTSNGAEWQFAENLEYLRHNGIVDESDPQNKKVMVANYMNAIGNCIASSRYYSVCCIDECEALLGHIEVHVRGSSASPETLKALVAALPSSTVAANRTISPVQESRLYKIAAKHGGQVPIHGRLFLQWMHMVYPRECGYPHMSGSTKPLPVDDWEAVNKMNSTASDEQMRIFVNAAPAQKSDQSQGQCGRWTDEEELFVGMPKSSRRALHELETDPMTWVAASSVALLCLLAATSLAVIHMFKSVSQLFGWKQKQPLMLV